MNTPASEKRKTGEVSFLSTTKVGYDQTDIPNIANGLQKQSTPPKVQVVAGCFPDEPSEEGVRLSLTNQKI